MESHCFTPAPGQCHLESTTAWAGESVLNRDARVVTVEAVDDVLDVEGWHDGDPVDLTGLQGLVEEPRRR